MNVQAFLSHRRKPRFKLPPGACDAHCHVFGPAAKFPYAPNRRYTPEDAPKEMLASLHGHLGIERAVIVQASCHGIDNAAMLDCIASDPKRYRGVAIVDDSFTDADFDKLDAGGVRGVRFNFVKHLGGAPDMAVFNRVIDRIKGRGWHVVLHRRCARYHSVVGHDAETAAAVHRRPHGSRALGRRRRSAAIAAR